MKSIKEQISCDITDLIENRDYNDYECDILDNLYNYIYSLPIVKIDKLDFLDKKYLSYNIYLDVLKLSKEILNLIYLDYLVPARSATRTIIENYIIILGLKNADISTLKKYLCSTINSLDKTFKFTSKEEFTNNFKEYIGDTKYLDSRDYEWITNDKKRRNFYDACKELNELKVYDDYRLLSVSSHYKPTFLSGYKFYYLDLNTITILAIYLKYIVYELNLKSTRKNDKFYLKLLNLVDHYEDS